MQIRAKLPIGSSIIRRARICLIDNLYFSSRQLGARHTETSELDLVDVRAVSVGRFAHVDARVFRVGVQDVERHETKVVHRPETMTYIRIQRYGIVEFNVPLDTV